MVAVRRIGAGDIAGYRAMNAVFSEVFAEPETYATHEPDVEYVRSWLAEDRNIALLAEADDLSIGALAGYRLDKFEQARSELYIYDLAVVESHRRLGVATDLIDEMRRIARAVGAWTVFVQADVEPEDAPARALYRKLASEEIPARHFDITP